MAYLADVFITLAVFCIIFFLIAILIALLASSAPGLRGAFQVLADMLGFIVFLLAFLSMWFYGAYMETNYNGQTIGKMLASIRTISTDGSAIDGVQATLRNFFRLLDVFPFISLGLLFGPEYGYTPIIPIFAFGLISMAISPKYQRIGDYVAGTIVVTEDKKWVHGLAKFQDPRVAELAGILPDSFVAPPGMARALAEFVDRRRVLPAQRVSEIAGFLAQPLLEKFELPPDTNPDLLLCSLYHKTFISRRDEEVETNPFASIEELASAEAALSEAVVQGDAP